MVREAVKLKKEAFRDWMAWRAPNSADRYRLAKQAAAVALKIQNVEEVWLGYVKILSVGLEVVGVALLKQYSAGVEKLLTSNEDFFFWSVEGAL